MLRHRITALPILPILAPPPAMVAVRAGRLPNTLTFTLATSRRTLADAMPALAFVGHSLLAGMRSTVDPRRLLAMRKLPIPRVPRPRSPAATAGRLDPTRRRVPLLGDPGWPRGVPEASQGARWRSAACVWPGQTPLSRMGRASARA